MSSTTVNRAQSGFSLAQYITCLNGIVWREALRFVHQRERFAAALVPAVLQARRGNRGLIATGLCFPADRVVLGHRAANDRLSHGAAGAGSIGPDARRARHADLLRHQAAREFCRRHELCYLPDVLCFLGALSAVAGAGGEPPALLCLPVQSVYPCRRTDTLRAVRTNKLDFAGGRL